MPLDSNLLNLDADELLLEHKMLLRALMRLNSPATAASFDLGLLRERMARAS